VTLTEKEFDDILQRNKSVSSGAIMRAVQDASEGQTASRPAADISPCLLFLCVKSLISDLPCTTLTVGVCACV